MRKLRRFSHLRSEFRDARNRSGGDRRIFVTARRKRKRRSSMAAPGKASDLGGYAVHAAVPIGGLRRRIGWSFLVRDVGEVEELIHAWLSCIACGEVWQVEALFDESQD